MAEWLYEEGIGENRAILVEDGSILEAAIELPGPRAGAIVAARLVSVEGVAALEDGREALVAPLPKGVTEGGVFLAEILREAIPERGRPKLVKLRPADAPTHDGPSLAERIGFPTPLSPHGPDRFEEAGWSELLEQARTGAIPFAGGALRMSVTPAMTLFDVDGHLDAAALARAGAEAATRAILRFDIGGSIGIDLPTVAGRAERQAPAAMIDALLPRPFERTAVNGFGFLQIVRRRERPSIPELARSDDATARALLRRAERLTGAVALHAAPAVVAEIEKRPDWLAALERRSGGPAVLRVEPGLAISAFHAEARPTG